MGRVLSSRPIVGGPLIVKCHREVPMKTLGLSCQKVEGNFPITIRENRMPAPPVRLIALEHNEVALALLPEHPLDVVLNLLPVGLHAHLPCLPGEQGSEKRPGIGVVEMRELTDASSAIVLQDDISGPPDFFVTSFARCPSFPALNERLRKPIVG
ncbi:hypothetical protein NKI77_10120 [Mesorhizobium opportunistum]|uniref:hypothetical protein n=1 Tax=Mesorhizobium opportunistum TaxID=593909 RepID=UPI0033355D50